MLYFFYFTFIFYISGPYLVPLSMSCFFISLNLYICTASVGETRADLEVKPVLLKIVTQSCYVDLRNMPEF